MLYLGYVGLTVPFAFAAGALLSGRADERWIIATRRWTLVAWMFLGFGQLLGAHWAYLEVGWGGYYAWDPVENVALIPWLVATAFLHSVMIQERKGMLRVWNVVLVALAFELSVFGTFLNRSGIVNSIHSFAKSSIGGWFLGFVVVSSLFSLGLIIWRLPLLRARTKLESALSREAAFLYNNLLLVALTLTILWGVIFPILTQLYNGEARTIGRPYYDFFLRAFGLPLLLLMGIGPLIAWRRTTFRALLRTLRWPVGVSIVAGIALILVGAGSSRPGLIAYTFCAFVMTTIVVELVRGTRATGSLFEPRRAEPAPLWRLRRPCLGCACSRSGDHAGSSTPARRPSERNRLKTGTEVDHRRRLQDRSTRGMQHIRSVDQSRRRRTRTAPCSASRAAPRGTLLVEA